MNPQLIDLPDDIEKCHELIVQLVLEKLQLENKLVKSQHDIAVLKEQMRDFARHRFGRSSEKLSVEQLRLFAMEWLQKADSLPSITGAVAEQELEKARRRGKPKNPPADLPKERIEYRLAGNELVCDCCGKEKKEIGCETTRQIEYVPATLKVIEHVQFKYACSNCQEGVATAAKPAQPIAGGIAGPGLVAHIAVSKHGDHLPLYRQEQIFKRLGYSVSRASMSRWMKELATIAWGVVNRMRELLLLSRAIHADETPLEFIDREKPRGQTRTGFLWTYYGDEEHPYVYFDFQPSRAAAAALSFLGDYTGYVHTDGYVAYELLKGLGRAKLVGCNAHARRGFEKALKSNFEESSHALAFYTKLFSLERNWKNYSEEERLEARKREALPLLNELESWLREKQLNALPRMKFGQSVNYCLNRWEDLKRYTEQGYLKIDNNLVENAIRPIAISRKNWLFAGSEEGGETAAIIASLIGSCKRNGVNPQDYLTDIIIRLTQNPGQDIDALLPDRWQHSLQPAT